MTGWHERILVSFDLETTGVDVETARIVTAAVVTINPIAGSVDTQQWLADPGVEIPEQAAAVHGITTEMARASGRPAAEVAAEIAAALDAGWRAGGTLVVFNAPYDLSLFGHEMARHGVTVGGEQLQLGPVVDPMCLDKHYDRYRPGSRKLTAVAAHYGIQLSELDAHGAAADALAAARVAWKLARCYPQLGAMTHEELHTNQVAWYREQAEGLAKYFRQQGKDDHVPTEWPIRPILAEAARG
ncbi:exonuclease domain-containing protein [Amycolatopsis eburnea]|uniref:3'-5' exonuclease n=1 Tax=Amycolatopsis eburnea TaxID=2267691 RepID=A0A3R9DMX3_9PSEU|nr:exonuclease domain-containing protein [Amycolatopsis eburnea]RSD21983.1 3'-5' exonuclease [Amycolatopsis eburnea]